MPFLSQAQSNWAHTPQGTKALGGVDNVKEWESHTDYSKLPKYVIAKKKKKEILKKMIHEQKIQNKVPSSMR